MNPIQFYTSVDVTLSEKLLEVMYCLIGLISIYVAFKNLKDKENKNSVGSFVFWFDLGVMFVLGKWLPALADGILLIILVLPPILKKVSPGNEPEPTGTILLVHHFKVMPVKVNSVYIFSPECAFIFWI